MFLHPHQVLLKILAENKTSLNVLLTVLVVEQWGPVLEKQHDLAAVAVVGPVVLLARGLERWCGAAGAPCI